MELFQSEHSIPLKTASNRISSLRDAFYNSMEVSVTIRLSVVPQHKHEEQMRSAARSLTNDPRSVRVNCPAASSKQICARFTVPDARQADVVDRIGRQFWQVQDYQDSSIGF